MNSPSGETSQTLDRGLTVLALLANNSDGLTAAELADELSTARAVVYRLLRTLEAHRLIGRIDTRYVLGIGIAELASKLRPQLQATVLPILRRLSEETNSTTLLSIADGDQALILLTEEPTRSLFHLALRQGARHPLDVGADGVAILAGRPPAGDDSDDVKLARRRGYALTTGALQSGAIGVAAPIRSSDWATASIGVVQLGVEVSDSRIPELVTAAAAEAAARLSGDFTPDTAAQSRSR
ncbi:IclR family transcriptional regulator [Lentzea aerocolonigenes]|uniref:IclR family transcriptional regulator n=1 Tax=Lentzea aerocolonigenes TaxID=68170 RepID=UPI00068EA18A|nr:helix-turn-helix domain-containing protein [Lentzea aerocolonigenes]MCP2243999.1 transcriptional regulator, IclR family [Lentzea aerocolonigenes]